MLPWRLARPTALTGGSYRLPSERFLLDYFTAKRARVNGAAMRSPAGMAFVRPSSRSYLRSRTVADKVLVTGGAGFIGSHTVDLLLERGYDVRVLDALQERVHPRGRPSYVPSEVEFVQGDVTSRETLEHALQGVTYVFHLAAYQDY